jgi:glycerol 3-phosphatase-2
MIDDFEHAWHLYRDAEVRLPSPPPRHTLPATGLAAGLREILAQGLHDAVILDAWGVLNLGDAPIPAAREAFAALRASGLAVRVLSNDAGSDPEQSSARHTRRGFAVAPEEIVFGLDLLAPTLAELGIAPEDCVLVSPRPAPRAAITAPMLDLYDPRAMDASAIAFLSTVGYTLATEARLRRLLRHRQRPVLVCNPDIVSPEPEGIAIEPGYYAHRLAAELGCTPTFLGKPFPGVYAAVMRTLPGVSPERVLCVGDTPHTDILGGAVAGMDTLLVESGFLRGRDGAEISALCAEAGLAPTWRAPHL